MAEINNKGRAFIAVMVAGGLGSFVLGMSHWQNLRLIQFLCYMAVAVMASSLKVTLPGINGTMSVNFLFVLLGVQELSLPQVLIVGCIAALVQNLVGQKNRPRAVQVLFNFSGMALAITATFNFHHFLNNVLDGAGALPLVISSAAYFLFNTMPVAVVISITENKPLNKIWRECYFWSFPYYLLGAGIAALIGFLNNHIGWQTSLLVLPSVYIIYRSYRLYLEKLENETRHVEEMASLHLRTIEALALAIEAKDHTTHDHLQRVRVYALQIGTELKIPDPEMEALRAAALLHDIGKLAVPEHIISKPGRLTPEEFEKMKIHPVVGAEILEQVQFPYPVVPIVLSHHEKWDGSGYPNGLKGEEIPIGARILAVVDCLDALASDRQYRRALPLNEAMEVVAKQAGSSFDPQVVEVLKSKYVKLEEMANSKVEEMHRAKLSTDIRVEKGEAPASGFENIKINDMAAVQGDFLSSIASARQEAQMFLELSHELGNSLSLNETLSLLSVRLKRLVAYDSFAVYLKKEEELVPEYVSGDDFRLFTSLRIPIAQGLSGWVAQNCKPIINGNPSVEPGYLNDPTKFSTLRSALAVPLEGVRGVIGVLSLYRADRDAFTQDDLRILLAISSKLTACIENALKYQIAEDSATIDYLTGLPNARSMFFHLDQEMSRCKRTGGGLTLLVCDLDGFKQVNDRFGHLEGNKVLRLFAERLKNLCREYDYVARMGGDEFVIIAPGLPAESVPTRMAFLEKTACEVGQEICGEGLLSVSVGAAYFQSGVDAEQLLCEADRDMYATKQRHHELPVSGKLLNFRARNARVQ